SLGFQTIYRLFNSHPEVRCERIFCLDTGQPGNERSWVALESGDSPSSFDVIALSLSYEQDCLMLPRLISAMGIPLRAQERWGNLPVLLCGGPVASSNPEPVAPFVEAVGVGDGEALAPEFVSAWLEELENGWERGSFLRRLALRRGFYVPQLYQAELSAGEGSSLIPIPAVAEAPAHIERQVDPLAGEPAHSAVVTLEAHFAGMFMIEIARGCCYACRFCLVSRINRPYRAANPGKIFELLERMPSGSHVVGLVGANLCDHPELEAILLRIHDRGLRLGAGSLILDTLSPVLLGLLRDCGVRTITLAPETASPRLLGLLGKPASAALLPEAVGEVCRLGFEQIKLYYMIGLPGEVEADREALVEQVRNLAGLLPGSGTRLRLSLNPFIPKPQTLWQDEPMMRPETLKAAMTQVRRGLATLGHKVELQTGPAAESLTQALISRGDRRMAEVLELAALGNKRFLDAAVEAGLDIDALLHKRVEPSDSRPWKLLE
ncbi:MAG: radical SAM protein, partial [Chloroflexi bacterium]